MEPWATQRGSEGATFRMLYRLPLDPAVVCQFESSK